MKPIVSLYLRLFLIMGIGFGIMMILLDLLWGDEFDLSKFLFRMIFFGGSMSATLGTLHVMKLKSHGIKSFTSDNLSVNQRRKVESSLSLQNLINLLRQDPEMGNMKLSEINNGLVLHSGSSWRSWGEKITITFKPKNDIINEFEIYSQPRISTTIVDGGKNFENVKIIEKLLKTGEHQLAIFT